MLHIENRRPFQHQIHTKFLYFVYITYWKYQVDPLSSLWFTTTCTDAVAHRSQFSLF